MTTPMPGPHGGHLPDPWPDSWPGLAARGAAFLAVWLVLTGFDPIDLLVGLPVAAAAARVSLALLPPGLAGIRADGLAGQILRLPVESLLAGIEVAAQAFRPVPRLRPGIVACPGTLPGGLPREAFLMLASLQPGALPVGEPGDGTVLVHALDTRKDVAGAFARAEARFRDAVCAPPGRGSGGG